VVGAVRESSAAVDVNGAQDDDDATDSGAGYVFVRTAGTWTQQAYLKPSRVDPGGQFGYRTAISGETVAIAAPYATFLAGPTSDDDEPEAGAVYVFVRGGGAWMPQATLAATLPGHHERFGIGLALDGDRLLVGAAFENGGGLGFCSDEGDSLASQSGAAYVIDRTGDAWNHFAYAKASNAEAGDQFGYAVALYKEWMLVGARGESSASAFLGGFDNPVYDDNDAQFAGAAYLMR
jgi:hypothetical protein